MRTLLYITAVFIMLSIFSCEKELCRTAKVVTDCTGTYLSWDGKDYKVCNLEKVSSFPSGTTVIATFKKIYDCKGSGNIPVTCYMNRRYESWIEVENIK